MTIPAQAPGDAPLPLLSLAPMQDVTDLAFLRTLSRLPHKGADLYTTPYFRVVSHALHLDPDLLEIITKNPTGQPVAAQIIGSDIDALCRTARALAPYAAGGIDLNIGCPAPIVCRKEAGGGALRTPARLDRMIGALRDAIPGRFSVKTRIGYDSPEEFDQLLPLFKKHAIDLLTIHGRTVREGYQTPVHPELVARAISELSCPVIANGNIVNANTARAWVNLCRPAGIMIGRGAIRNPWLFSQIRTALSGQTPAPVLHRQLKEYIDILFEETARLMTPFREISHIHRMKKFMVYICQGLPPAFEYDIRRATDAARFHALCRDYLDNDAPVPDSPPPDSKLFAGFRELETLA